MKLLKLSSNNPKFKTLNFKDGLNIVAGIQFSKEDRKTYNGIGKSFSLNLVHLMLGAGLDKKKKNEAQILNFLEGYGEFELEFLHKNETYKITKNFAKPHYTINGEDVPQYKYGAELKRILVDGFDGNVSFRMLFNMFARRFGSSYYSDFMTQQGRPKHDYYQAYTNLSLLGVNTSLVAKKAEIKDSINLLVKAEQVIAEYERHLDATNIKDKQDELVKLEQDKEKFIIAENYDEFKAQADSLTQELNELRNELHLIKKKIAIKLESLEQSKSIDIDIEEITNIYKEVKFFFEEKITVRLDEAQKFHNTIMNSRVNRLKNEIGRLQSSRRDLEQVINEKGEERDSILKDLSAKGALEEYNSLAERIRSISVEIQELKKFKEVLDDFKLKKANLDADNAKINKESLVYLNEAKDYLGDVENKFRALVKKFYKNSGGSLKVEPTKDAKYLFNVDVHVPQDGSQGIGEVKIFCYDFLLYQLNPSLLNFIAHDGCIFSEMDPRQKAMIFKVALEYVLSNGLQYFVNIGQASLDEVLDKDGKYSILSEPEKKEIQKSVILELYDEDPSTWLFGSRFG